MKKVDFYLACLGALDKVKLLKQLKWRTIFSVVKYVYTPITFGFIFYFLFKNITLFKTLYLSAKLSYLAVAVCLWAGLHLLAPISPLLVLRSFGYSLSYKKMLKIHVSRLPARYIPGGVWQTVGRLADYHSHGIIKKHLKLLAVFETVFPIPVAFFIGGSLLWLSSPGVMPNYIDVVSTIISCILLVVPLIVVIKNPLNKYFPLRNIHFYFRLLLLSLTFWFIAALSFFLYYNAILFTETASQSFLPLAGAYVFSWGTGYVSVFAPQGIGVFEVVVGKIINIPMSLGSAVAFIAGFRLIALLADFFVYFSFLFKKLVSAKDYSSLPKAK